MLSQTLFSMKKTLDKGTKKFLKKLNQVSQQIEEDLSEGRLSLGKKIDFDTSLLNRKNQLSLPKLYKPALRKSQHSLDDQLKIEKLRAGLKEFYQNLEVKTERFEESERKKKEEERKRSSKLIEEERLKHRFQVISRKQIKLKNKNVQSSTTSQRPFILKSMKKLDKEIQKRDDQIIKRKEEEINQKIKEIQDKKRELVQIQKLNSHQQHYLASLESMKLSREAKIKKQKSQRNNKSKEYQEKISKSPYYYKVQKQNDKNKEGKEMEAFMKEQLRQQVKEYAKKIRKAFSHIKAAAENPDIQLTKKKISASNTQLKSLGNQYLRDSVLRGKKKEERKSQNPVQTNKVKSSTDYLRKRRQERAKTEQEQKSTHSSGKYQELIEAVLFSEASDEEKIENLKRMAYAIDSNCLEDTNPNMVKKVLSKLQILKSASNQHLL